MHRIHRPSAPLFLLARAIGRPLAGGIPVALALTGAALLTASPAPADTVSCSSADKPAEFAICNSEDLQILDEKLDNALRREMALLGDRPSQQNLSRRQSQWVVERNACNADDVCLTKRYQERLSELATGHQTRVIDTISAFKRFAGNDGG